MSDGTGFFCKRLDKKLLITNNHVINKEIIKEIIKDKKIIKVKLNDNKIKKDIKIKDYYTSIKWVPIFKCPLVVYGLGRPGRNVR